jgi:hypothetical protein
MDSNIDASKLSDRELLLLLHERQGVMSTDVKELKDGTQKEMATLSMEVRQLRELKADTTRVEALERGQNRLFNYLWAMGGALGLLQIVIPIVVQFLKH